MNTHALLGSEQAPLHVGASAWPHDTERHSHDADPIVTPQRLPGPQLPVHAPSL